MDEAQNISKRKDEELRASHLSGDRFIATAQLAAFESPGKLPPCPSNTYSRTLQEQLQLGGAVMRYDVSRTPERPPNFQLPPSTSSHYVPQIGDSESKQDSAMCTPRQKSQSSQFFAPSLFFTPQNAKNSGAASSRASRTPSPSPPPAFFGAVAYSESPMQGTSPFMTPRTPFQSPSKPFRSNPSSLLKHRHREGINAIRILNAEGISTDASTHILAWSESSLVVALGSSVYSWAADGAVHVLMDHQAEVTALATFDDVDTGLSFTAVGLQNGLVQVVSGIHLFPHSNSLLSDHIAKVTSIAICFYTMISASSDGVLVVRDLRRGCVVHRATLTSPIVVVEITRDGNHVAIGCSRGLVILHSSNWGEVIRLCDSPSPIRCVAWSPHRLGVLAYSIGSELRMHSLGSNEFFSLETHATIVSLVWSTTTTEIVVGHGAASPGYDHLQNCIAIYDARNDCSTRVLSLIEGHRNPPQHMCLQPDGATLVSGAGGVDSTLRFWELFPAATSRPRLSPTSAFEEKLR